MENNRGDYRKPFRNMNIPNEKYRIQTDPELLVLISKNDQDAFAALYSRYFEDIYIHVYTKLGNEEEAKDAVHEIFLKLWERRDRASEIKQVKGYLFTITRNYILDLIAHHKIIDKYYESFIVSMQTEHTDYVVREKDIQRMIDDAIAELPPIMREVFELSRKEYLSYKEIAAHLQISEKTVKTQMDSASTILSDGLLVKKTEDGSIVYESLETNAADEERGAKMNTLRSPKGNKYSLKLSDGTLVMLNGMSTIRFPDYFSPTGAREVYVEGEAYFDVTPTENVQPFIVHTEAYNIEVLGTKFIVAEQNNAIGANPNMLPTIELRGQTSIPAEALQNQFSQDPNLPLFILDGFESDLRTIVDLDMNIIKSATILKDAASTALYGSRASNGVVVAGRYNPLKVKLR